MSSFMTASMYGIVSVGTGFDGGVQHVGLSCLSIVFGIMGKKLHHQ